MTAPTAPWAVEFAEPLVVVRGQRDAHGDVVSYSEHTLPLCIVAPTATSDGATDRGEQVSDDYTVYVLDGHADLLATDRVRRPSDPSPIPTSGFKARSPWVVQGTPARWRSPFSGWAPGLVVRIKREQGVAGRGGGR